MNTSYKSIWNESLGAWVAASEITTGRGKRSKGGHSAPTPSAVERVRGHGHRLAGAISLAILGMAMPLSPAFAQFAPEGSGGEATGSAAIAIGGGTHDGAKAFATHSNSIAIGGEARATQNNALAFGTNAQAINENDLAVGSGAIASGAGSEGPSSAFGFEAQGLGNGAIAFGTASYANGNGALANGYGASGVGNLATAIGARSNVAGNMGTAIGAFSIATANFATAIGGGVASGVNSFASGDESAASAQEAVALGFRAKAANVDDVAIGALSVTRAAHTGITALYGATAQGIAKTPSGVASIGDEGTERQLQNVAAGVISNSSTDAVNGSQLQSVATGVNALGDSTASILGNGATYDAATGTISGFSAPISSVDANGKVSTAPAQTTVGGALGALNTNIDNLAGSAVQYDADSNKGSVTLGGVASTEGGKTGGTRLSNVAQGALDGTSTDAVNGAQLNTTNNNASAFLGGGADVASGKAPTYDVAGGSFNDVGSALGAVDQLAGKGWNLSANGAAARKIAPGETVDFIDGSNTTVTRTEDKIQVNVSKTPTFDSVTVGSGGAGTSGTGSATLGANGLTTIGTDGKAGPSVSTAGIDAGDKPITNVGDGNVAAGSKDAVNGGQLNTTNANTSTFLGGGADVGAGKAPTYEVAGDKFNDVGSALDAVDKLAGNGVQYDKNADGTPGKSSVTLGGADTTTPVKLGNVADGTAPTDAVNRSQLDTVSTTANLGWNLSANSGAAQKIAPGETVDFIDGSNTAVTRTDNQIQVNVSKTPTFDSVTVGSGVAGTPGTGSAMLGANGLTTIGPDGKTGPSVTTAGIDAAGKPITNVGTGTNGTDAANVDQVKAVEAKADNAVQYDAKDGKPGKESVTLGGVGATTPVQLANVKDGELKADSKDAVNGGQLNTTNQNVTNLGNSIANGQIGPVQAVPGKTDQLTLVAKDGSGAAPGNAQVLGNVAAGTATTDAANVGQLNELAGSAVQYDKNANGTPGKSSVTLGGADTTTPVKLTNVAAGAAPTDAVNRSQLDTVSTTANLGWNLSTNGAGVLNIAPGGTVDFIDGSNTAVTRTDNQIQVNVSKTPTFDSVTVGSGVAGTPGTGSAMLGANGLTTIGTDGKTGPSVTTAGIDAGSKPITNVGAGTNGTDAANVGQVKAVEAKADNAVQYDKSADGTPGKNGVTLGGLNADGTAATAPVKLTNVADGNVAAGSKDAVNGGQLNTTNQNVTNLGDNIRNGAIGPMQAVPGKTDQLTLVAPGATGAAPGNAQVLGNVADGKAPTDAANVGQLDALAGSAVQYDKNADGAPGKSAVTLGGTNVDGTPATAPVKLGNVADGTAPNDAVNRGQLDSVSTTANKGWNLSANSGAAQKIAPGGTVDFIDGSNTTVTRTDNKIQVNVSKTPTFDSVTVGSGVAGTPGTGSATLGANGLTTIGTDGKAGASVTSAGIDAAGKPITNVGAGTNGTDAANVDQVKAVEAKADNAVQYDKNADGTPGKSTVTLGGTNADGTPATSPVKLGNVADGNLAAGSKDAVNGGQLNTTNETITKLGDSVANGTIGPVQAVPGKTDQLTLVAPGATGAAPGNAQVLGNVADGKAPTDAANVGQLDALAGSAVQYDKNADGTPGKNGVTLGGLNADGTPATAPVKLSNVADGTAPNDAVNRGQLDTVSTTANLGWNLSANSGAAQKIAPGGIVDFIDGSNTTVTRTDNKIQVNVSKTPTFDSVTVGSGVAGTPGTGSATLGADGLTTIGTDGKAGPSVTTAGIDAAGKPISNVGAGTNGTDAANVDQVKAVEAKADNAVQYDAKNGAPGKDSVTLGGLNADGTAATAPVKLTNVADGNVAASSKDAINGGQLNTTNQNVTNLGDNIRNGAIGPVQAVPGKTDQLTLVAPGATGAAPGNAQVLGNVADGKAPTDAANVGQLDALAGSAVQYDKNADGTPGKNGVTLGGLNADGTPATAPVKLSNVADGTAPNDAVNRGQLDTVSTTANLGWNLSANSGAAQKIAPGGIVDFIDGSNTTVTRTDNKIQVNVSKTPTFDSVTVGSGVAGTPGTGSATLGANGLTTIGTDGKAGASVTSAGIDAAGKPITNVGAGTNGTDAANVDQVKAVEAKADNAVQYDKNADGTPGKSTVTLGGTNADGTPATSPVKLGNVADGNVAAGSTDAVNGGQLNTLGTGIGNVLGGSYTNGVYTPPTFVTVGGGTATTVQGALDNLGAAVAGGAVGPVQQTGKDGQLALVAPGATGAAPGAAQQLTNVKNGELSSTSSDAVNGSQLHEVSEAVAAVGTKADNSVQYDKGVDGTPGKSSITLGGMGADGKTPSTDPVKLGNVADGNLAEGSKDAVNGGQLFTTNQNVTNLGNDLKNLSTNINDGKVGPLQRTGNADELVLVGKDGTAANPGAAQRVTNVANGTRNSDAVNFGQLKDVASTANNSLQYDGADKRTATMGGTTSTDGGKTGGTKVTNVAQGAVNDKSTDAVNGAQLDATNTAVSKHLGGGANLNEGKAPSYTVQGNTYDNVGGALGSVNDNLTTVNNAINGGGMKYFRVNSALPDATAGGTDAVAVGPQAVASGASSVAVGSGAQATSASGTAIGFKAVVQQTGGVALGAGSVASTAAGVAGYVPEGAGAQQASAVRATKGTQGAVSVGDAGNGQFRQITGVAAGTADSDAANVAQLKASASAAKAGSVQYDTNADGTPNYGQITMGNGQAPDGTRISNVAPGVQGNDAVNVNQLNGATALSMNYTDARVNQLGHALQDVAKKSYAGTAAAMAMETAPYIAGKVTYAAGMGHYQGQTAVGASLRKTAESGRWSVSGGVTATSAGTVGVRAGISGVWD
jgi:autotransporter adhesin